MEQGKIWTAVLCLIAHTFRYMVTEGSEKRIASIQFIKPNSHALKCENGRYAVSYMFRYLLGTSGSPYMGSSNVNRIGPKFEARPLTNMVTH